MVAWTPPPHVIILINLNIKIPSFTVNYDVSTNLNESINAKRLLKCIVRIGKK